MPVDGVGHGRAADAYRHRKVSHCAPTARSTDTRSPVVTAYLSLKDLAFLLRWIAEKPVARGKTPAVVSEPRPIRRTNGRIVMLGND